MHFHKYIPGNMAPSTARHIAALPAWQGFTKAGRHQVYSM